MRTIFADATIGAGEGCSAAGMVELRDEPENMPEPEIAVGEIPFADALGTT